MLRIQKIYKEGGWNVSGWNMSELLHDLGISGLKLLLTLYIRGDGKPTVELLRTAKVGSGTGYRALGWLVIYGLVRIEAKGNSKYVMLTRDGREVAELLDKLVKKLEEVKVKRQKEEWREGKRGERRV